MHQIPPFIRDAIRSCIGRLPEKYREFAAQKLVERFLSFGTSDDLYALFDLPDGEKMRVNWTKREERAALPYAAYWLCSVEIISHAARSAAKQP